ncbi:hypothetical protein IQ06DRAFT_360514 [Phaeosphaeriaceae sp. SRC1lsM3a]|nr:hypothetical protein IQ06DRAFT_360514 [Stagonospora sp. SRC1lsM3a]
MTRTVYLAVFTNGSKPAHWSIWIPTAGQDRTGKLIHVTGNPATGFFLEFKRNFDRDHDIDFTETEHRIVPLGQVTDGNVKDLAPTAPQTRDTTARDRLESLATTVVPPGRSANPFDPAALNCQDWIEEFIEKLIAEDVIDAAVRATLQEAPRRLRS